MPRLDSDRSRELDERRTVESALRRSEKLFRGAFECTNVAMVLTDVAHRFVRVNAAFARLFGYSEAELLQMALADVTHPDHLAESLERRQELLAGRAEFFEMEKRYLHKDGHVFWGLANISLVRDERGRPLQYVGQVLDITQRKRNEENQRRVAAERVNELNSALEARVAELATLNGELESFCYSISHDLRAPLRAIDGFSRILLKDFAAELSPGAAGYLADVRSNTRQMGQLIDDLLAFSRLSRQPLKTQTVAPARLVGDCLRELLSQTEGRPADVHVGELAECEADPALLKQVWFNLISNAFKYSGKCAAPAVEIGCRSDGPEGIVYFVKDNGVGFDMKYAGKLFGVFQRLHRAEDYAGTGVGLAIVQRIVNRHGGRVWAESQPGQGATFLFTLQGTVTP